jgi:hypothetical protein
VAGRAETHKNGHSARADAVSIRPSALDRESWGAQSSRALCEAVISAAADAPYLGSGGDAETLVRLCIGRLSMVAGIAHARCLRQLAAVCCADALPAIVTEEGRALGPMLPASAREHWPFFVLRDSCHAALPDQLGLP